MKYQINDIYPCVQGEGVYTGTPMVLVRMHGCPVGCPWCVTKFTWGEQGNAKEFEVEAFEDALGNTTSFVERDATQIAQYIRDKYPNFDWVLLTGGEPAMQDLGPLVQALHMHGLMVSLETSGTAMGHLNVPVDWTVVSPKPDMPGGRSIVPEAIAGANELKWPVGRTEDVTIFNDFCDHYNVKESVIRWVQPLSMSKKATDICVAAAMASGKLRISIQVHKIINER